jgi:hypothetical protein
MLLWLKSLPDSLNKIKFYAFEFILIFVAVAAGAWVENLRENLQEKDKEKQLMLLMIGDLQKDTAEISAQIKLLKTRRYGLDSITKLVYSNPSSQLNHTQLQRLQYNYVLPAATIGSNTRAKIQIEGVGHDIISSEKIVIGVLNYWALQKDISFNNNRYQDYWWESRKLAYQLFDSRFIHRVNGVLTVSPEAKLLPHTDGQLIQYCNWVSNMSALLEIIYVPNLEKQSKAAAELIILIQQEYDFEP